MGKIMNFKRIQYVLETLSDISYKKKDMGSEICESFASEDSVIPINLKNSMRSV